MTNKLTEEQERALDALAQLSAVGNEPWDYAIAEENVRRYIECTGLAVEAPSRLHAAAMMELECIEMEFTQHVERADRMLENLKDHEPYGNGMAPMLAITMRRVCGFVLRRTRQRLAWARGEGPA